MKINIKEFVKAKKDVIKNVIILVLVPVTVLSLIGISSMNKIVDSNIPESLNEGDEIQEEVEETPTEEA